LFSIISLIRGQAVSRWLARYSAPLTGFTVVCALLPMNNGQAVRLAAHVPCGRTLSAVHPAAGSTLALRRGCTYSGPLIVRARKVTVTSYGAGSRPVITLNRNGAAILIYGSHDKIEKLSLKGVAPRRWTCGGAKTPAGHVDGIDIEPGAAQNTVSHVYATGFYAAVHIKAGSNGNTVQSSTFNRNLQLDTNNKATSAGAFGVLIWGSSNIIQYNTIKNNQACSLAYGHDGSAIEIYGGSHNLIRSNKAANNSAFTELGSYPGHPASSNEFYNNVVTDGTSRLHTTFLITRGSGDPNGPVYKTVAAHNTAVLTRSGDRGAISYAWQRGDGALLTLVSNYLNLGNNEVLYEDGGYINGGGNTFIGTCNPKSDC
jgi:hypothetical protein